MLSLEENKENFDVLNTIAVGISVDSVPSKAAWAKELGIENTRLLSDFYRTLSLCPWRDHLDWLTGQTRHLIAPQRQSQPYSDDTPWRVCFLDPVGSQKTF